jgi:protein phosphatase PTC7
VGSGVGADSADTPASGDVIDLPVYPGDIVILSTDGVLDNLFPHEMLSTVMEHAPPPPARKSLFPPSSASADTAEPPHADPQAVAQALADCALRVALDERRQSPFAVNAQDAGHIYRGGKIDDITCVVAVVVRAPVSVPTSPITPTTSPLPPPPPPPDRR